MKKYLIYTLIVIAVLLPGNGWSQTRTLVDMVGRTVSLTRPVNRIVTTFKPTTLCLFSMGLQDKLVGIDTSSKKDPLTLAVMPDVAKLTAVGSKSTGINFETVTSLKPDLVILYAQKDGFDLAQRLGVMEIPSIIILPESFESVKTSLNIIALAAGVPERADRVVKLMDGVLLMVDHRVATLGVQEQKTGYFASSRGLFSTATGSMLQDEIFQRAGVVNVAHDLQGYFQDISPEQLLRWNPDLMVISQHLHNPVAKRLNDPVLRRVKAVANRDVYRSPSNLAPWDFPSPLAVLGTLWLANRAYPDLFSDIDLGVEVDRFHAELFGRTMTEMGGTLNDLVLDGAGL
ncbi:Fbp2 [Desulforapulum autotrophicum HRM2]|uniref:Fbp2 n=1 Tax=Desulforapulum autotrophicum (strain ATCC 43914 / DSM 3382 / VKM B-1955 / HRM2) TaxID=177437 RepID=C0Q8W4_DESAH|nr:ABC transporter substrate-binding protein [Desulforapulum autotrophicum]ACN14454.1 Fbp2 [Desulforapulum autotrophicum HRM2]